MPKLVSTHVNNEWRTRVKCPSCKWTYEYFAGDVVVGEDSSDSTRACVYCGNCKYTLWLTNVPRKVYLNATRY